MRMVRVVLVLLVAVLIACPVFAQEKQKKKRRPGGPDPLNRLLEGLNLTDEQKAKIEDVKKDFAPKLAEIAKKRAEVFTPEERKARAEAEKAAKEAGKSPREVSEAVRNAVTLSDEQRQKMREIFKEERGVMAERLEKVKAILTAEQKEQLEKRIEELKSKAKKKRD